MRTKRKVFYILMALAMAIGLLGMQPVQPVEAGTQALRISQVYGGGNNSNATYTHDFIEIFNAGTAAVSLDGLSLQYTSPTGTGNFGASDTQRTELPNVSLEPGKYFLVQEAGGSTNGDPLPTPDHTDSTPIAMGASAGKVALVTGTDSLGCNGGSNPCDAAQLARIIDLVGFGNANFYEGTTPAPAASNTTSVQRESNGCQDTDQNGDDFIADAPIPRNTASPTHACSPVSHPERFIISEYVEGSSSNKAIELYNGTGVAIDLQNYRMELFANGSTTPSNPLTWATETILAAGDTYVIVNNSASDALKAYSDLLHGITNFNGDDAFVLYRITPEGNVVQDSFGQRGVDPGTGWGSGDTSTVNRTLVRKATVCQGDLLPDDAFEPATEYNGFPEDTFTNLGSHTMNCGGADLPPTVVSTIPANNATNVAPDSNISITFSEPVTVTGEWFTISCVNSGTHTATVTDNDPTFVLDPEINFASSEVCTVTVLAANVTDDDEDDAVADHMLENYVFSFTTAAGCGDPFTPIYDIQGSGAASPMVGQTVTTEGVVTGDFQEGGKKGFFIQDVAGDGNDATSDGIFVYYPNGPEVNVGDKLRITGRISEYYELTQMNGSALQVCSSGNTIDPVVLTLPFNSKNHEHLEGMLVTFPQPLVISEYFNFDRYGELLLTSTRHTTPTAYLEPGPDAVAAQAAHLLDSIAVDDGSSFQNPSYLRHPDGSAFSLEHYFRGGDTIQGLTGVLDYNFNEYKVQPVGTATYSVVNLRTEAPELVPGEIRVASLNVLNYFVTIDTGAKICGPSGNMECRGADDATELQRQTAKVVNAIVGMDADIVGLIEIENEHPGQTPDQPVATIVAALNQAVGPETYAYIATGPIGTDAIKQAILYKPAKVEPVGTFAILDASVDPDFDTTRNRPALAMTFRDKITGEIFTVSVNHLKSKGSACDGDPDLGDGAGNCNLTRYRAAKALVKWLENDPTDTGSDMYVIIGDLNSYAMEDPIDALKLGADQLPDTADDLYNLVDRFNENLAYGYVYGGQTGYLDHALANRKLASYVLDADFWHINADEADVFDYDMTFKPDPVDAMFDATTPYRSSDHDPVLISLLLNHEPTAVDDTYSTNQGVALDIPAPGVLANDTDPNIYDNITASLVTGSGPANGTLEFNEDGSFVYTPNPEFSGTDSFQYTMHATPGLMAEYSDIATVTITVIDTTAPEIVSVTAIGAEGFADVLADNGVITVDQGYTVARTEIVLNEAVTVEAGTVVSVGGQPYGTITAEGNKLIVTPYPGNETASQIGTFVFSVPDGSVTDLAGNALVELSVTLVVNNVAPVAVNDAYTVAEDGTLTVEARGVLINDTDYNPNILTAIKLSDPANGTLTLNADGSFVYTPTANFNGTDSFTYKANDGELDSNVATVTITVTPVNDMPAAEDIEVTTSEDTAINITLLGSDVDGNTLTYEIVAEPTNGTITVVGNVATYTPNQNYNGNDSFTYKANDGELDSNVATVTITVTPVNDAPVLDEIADVTIPERQLFTFTATATDVDDTQLTFSLITPPEGAAIDPETGEFTWTPTHEQVGAHEITLCVSDGELEACQNFTITVFPVNTAPVAVEDEYTLNQDETFNVEAPGVLENDSDPENDALTAVLVVTTQHGTLTLNADGSLTYIPDAGFYGEDSFTYKAFDGEYYSEEVTVTLTIVRKPVWNIYLPIIMK